MVICSYFIVGDVSNRVKRSDALLFHSSVSYTDEAKNSMDSLSGLIGTEQIIFFHAHIYAHQNYLLLASVLGKIINVSLPEYPESSFREP